MSKFSLLFIILSLVFTNGFAQFKSNTIYAEIGGNGGLYSLNYDKLFILSQQLKLAPRIGISWLGGDRFTLPIEANLLLGKNTDSKNYAEFGIGTTIVSKKTQNISDFSVVNETINEKGANAILTSRLGFRHQKPSGGFMYRIGLTFLYNSQSEDHKLLPFGGISFGHSF
jgi:hypothetical protein